jgi:3-deoxy-7-phosphoheptulonate synthase
MIFRENSQFISPDKIYEICPVSRELRQKIALWREQITSILHGEGTQKLLIVGPCSIHNVEAAYEYATHLKDLADQVSDVFLIVMRAYFEKPRTASGWKGLLYDPHLNGTHDILNGIRISRTFLIEMAKLDMPCATEFLDPCAAPYFADLISWGCIGARTSQSQVHRQLASALPMPIGFKNRCDGNIEVAIKGAMYAKNPHRFLGIGPSGHVAVIQGHGNICPHIVLRGSESGPNYQLASIKNAIADLEKNHMPPHIIVDCSHDNSRKNHTQQATVFSSIVDNLQTDRSLLAGIMLESFLLESNQHVLLSNGPHSHDAQNKITYGASLTDACLDWESTSKAILDAYAKLSQQLPNKQIDKSRSQCALLPT